VKLELSRRESRSAPPGARKIESSGLMSAQTNSTEFTLCPPMATLTIADAIEADKTIAVVTADITAQKGDSIDRLPARRIRWLPTLFAA